jgi:hypothetical protein
VFLKSQPFPQRRGISITKIYCLMPYAKIIAVKNDTERINTICGQNEDLLDVKANGNLDGLILVI